MVWPMIAMAAVSAVGAIAQSRSASSQNANQQAWNNYNSQMGYNNDMSNIAAQSMLGMFNASMQMQAGQINADAIMKAANYNAAATAQLSSYNAGRVQVATDYNNLLLAQEEQLLLEKADLDETYVRRAREKERGDIVNAQAASGTTIGEGSNKDVVIEQRAQEEIDAFVIRHGAEIGAAKIQNAMAQSTWQGQSEIQKIMYEGQVGTNMTLYNAKLNAQTTLANAQLGATSTMMNTIMGASSATQTADYQLAAGISGATQTFSTNQAQISSNLTQGLFSSASQAYGAYSSRAVSTSGYGVSGSNVNVGAGYGSWTDGSLLASGGR